MPKCGKVVEEWLAGDFPLKIDQSTNRDYQGFGNPRG
jgi:hypothetical protein